MVTVTAFSKHQTTDGKEFISLELSGGLELVQSQQTGNFYATVRKCNIPSTFDETIAKLMIGQQLEGDIVRVEVDPYEYTNPRTGEVVILSHSYAYRPKGSMELISETPVQQMESTRF
jgi:hypothetical protein